jgi:hypothetical protein
MKYPSYLGMVSVTQKCMSSVSFVPYICSQFRFAHISSMFLIHVSLKPYDLYRSSSRYSLQMLRSPVLVVCMLYSYIDIADCHIE